MLKTLWYLKRTGQKAEFKLPTTLISRPDQCFLMKTFFLLYNEKQEFDQNDHFCDSPSPSPLCTSTKNRVSTAILGASRPKSLNPQDLLSSEQEHQSQCPCAQVPNHTQSTNLLLLRRKKSQPCIHLT
ncbi:hypothetical protein KIL84_013242 [Mauremys mutica]|uniref:Uncharacterized protein n=1 Tax=Mauremys mutica TaxID=74926 RepID=A0A9D3WV68_9SAUR|nr:hypothetical protein KIL84_013242 [Mauremys mutica]